jgi:hypothetical protein
LASPGPLADPFAFMGNYHVRGVVPLGAAG